MARFRRRFVSERKATFEIQQGVFLRCLPKKILALMMILFGEDAVKVTGRLR